VIVAGAGVGKSRLAREAQAAATRAGAHVAWATATRSAAGVPLAALTEIVPDDVRGDDIVALMRRSGEELRAAAGGKPVVVAVDDAHLLDPVSAALVLHLASSGTAFVIATLRSGEQGPDAITSLWKDAGARRLELSDLADAEIEELVQAALGAPVEASALEWVRAVGRGNVLYVRELIRGAVQAGTLVLVDGFWRLEGRPTASASLVELVGTLMGGLSDEQRRVIELLALGEPLSVDEIVSLTSEDTLIAVERRGLLRAEGRSVGLAHPLFGETFHDSLATLHARRMRLELVEVIEAREPFGPDDALRSARLRLDAGAPLPPALTRTAAAAANSAGDPDLGAELAAGAGAAESIEAAMLLAQAHVMRSRYADAETAFAAVEQLAPLDPDHARRYLARRLWLYQWGLRWTAETAALIDRAASWFDTEEWARLIARLRQSYETLPVGFGEPEDYAPSDDPALTDEGHRIRAVMHTIATFVGGEGNAAAVEAFAARPPVPLRDPPDIAMLGALALVATETGYRWDEVEEYMGDVLRAGVRSHDHDAAGLGAFTLARLRFVKGAYRDATRWLAEAEVHLVQRDPFNVMLQVRCLRVGIAAFGSDFEAAATALERMRAWAENHPPLPLQLVPLRRAEGWVLRLRNPAEAADRLVADAAELNELPGLTPQLVYDAFRAGAGAAAASALRELTSDHESRLARAYAAHALAHADRDGPALLAAGEEFAAIGADRYAVEAFSDAARTFIAAGREDSARRAAARGRDFHPADQGGELPVIDGLDATATQLTPREAQLVGLASQGLSNAEIAGRLVISVRTVETHLYRGMQKLGISDRRDL
jgi:DNA-binding NarL/FixJ family response regulator